MQLLLLLQEKKLTEGGRRKAQNNTLAKKKPGSSIHTGSKVAASQAKGRTAEQGVKEKEPLRKEVYRRK